MMICGNCNKIGIHWVGPYGNLTGTKCPHCGGTNCQLADHPDQAEEEIEAEVECGCGRKSGPRTLMMVATTAAANGACHDHPPAHPAPAHLARLLLCPLHLHLPDAAQRHR